MKKERNFGVFAWMLCAAISLCGCMTENSVVPASETTLVDVDKNVEFSTNVVDALGSSVANIDVESSTISVGDDGTDVRRFEPTCYLKVELAEEHIELASVEETEVTLLEEKVISDNEISEGAIRGRDVVKEFTFSDGQIATVSYGWQYEMDVVDAEKVAAPHVEISNIRYINHVVEMTGVGTYKATPAFDATLVTVSVSSAKAESLTLRPWYTMSVVASEPEPEPEYTFEVVWGTWVEGDYATEAGAYLPVTVYAHKSVGGEAVKTDETTFHLYTPALREDFTFRGITATSGNTGNLEVTSYDEDSFERGGFFHTTHVTRFSYMWVFETFRFQTSLVELVYTDGDYSATLEVGLDTTWEKQEDVMIDSNANNPNYEGGRYIGTDIFTFSSEKVVRTDANYTEKDASGENVMVFTFNIDKIIYE